MSDIPPNIKQPSSESQVTLDYTQRPLPFTIFARNETEQRAMDQMQRDMRIIAATSFGYKILGALQKVDKGALYRITTVKGHPIGNAHKIHPEMNHVVEQMRTHAKDDEKIGTINKHIEYVGKREVRKPNGQWIEHSVYIVPVDNVPHIKNASAALLYGTGATQPPYGTPKNINDPVAALSARTLSDHIRKNLDPKAQDNLAHIRYGKTREECEKFAQSIIPAIERALYQYRLGETRKFVQVLNAAREQFEQLVDINKGSADAIRVRIEAAKHNGRLAETLNAIYNYGVFWEEFTGIFTAIKKTAGELVEIMRALSQFEQNCETVTKLDHLIGFTLADNPDLGRTGNIEIMTGLPSGSFQDFGELKSAEERCKKTLEDLLSMFNAIIEHAPSYQQLGPLNYLNMTMTELAKLGWSITKSILSIKYTTHREIRRQLAIERVENGKKL